MPKSKNVTYPRNAQTKLSGNRLNIQVQVGLTIQLEKRIVCSLVLRSNISTKNQHQYQEPTSVQRFPLSSRYHQPRTENRRTSGPNQRIG